MAQNKTFSYNIGLTATTTTNIINPGTTTGGVGYGAQNLYFILTHIRVNNNAGAAVDVALWLGATGTNLIANCFAFAGTATAGALDASTGESVPANSHLDWNGRRLMTTADFLVGGARTASKLNITIEGEVGVA